MLTRQKCMRVRCKSCGFVRAKNTTRQVEHLALCQDFLNSPEGQHAVDSGELELAPSAPGPTPYNNSATGADIWRGSRPNPNLLVGNRPSNGAVNHLRPPQRPNPSLVNHLLNKWPEKFTKATQLQFLSHAGCGTLSAPALSHWLGQNGHISRAMIAFIGNLIGKVRLPDVPDSKQSTQFRALDLLISTVSNLRKEIDFIENTKRKYGIHTDNEPPLPITKAYVDLLTSSAESRSSLLEGMVALWATEHVGHFYFAAYHHITDMHSATALLGNTHRLSHPTSLLPTTPSHRTSPAAASITAANQPLSAPMAAPATTINTYPHYKKHSSPTGPHASLQSSSKHAERSLMNSPMPRLQEVGVSSFFGAKEFFNRLSFFGNAFGRKSTAWEKRMPLEMAHQQNRQRTNSAHKAAAMAPDLQVTMAPRRRANRSQSRSKMTTMKMVTLMLRWTTSTLRLVEQVWVPWQRPIRAHRIGLFWGETACKIGIPIIAIEILSH